MKKLLLALLKVMVVANFARAQGVPEQHNKTYYDAEKTKMKEVYALREETQMDPANPSASKSISIKHGPYFYYYETGKLKISGQYKDDKKSGEWKYYDEAGKLNKTEKYENGNLVP